jgi:hypothetical protein
MALSIYAEKLLAWFNMYKVTPAQYETHLNEHPKAQRRGIFETAFEELLVVYPT